MTDRRRLRTGPRPDSGAGRPKAAFRNIRISARVPEDEHVRFRQLSDDLNESQAILRAIRLWVAIAEQRNDLGENHAIPNVEIQRP